MKKSNRASRSNVKIANALRAMQERFSFTEFKKWNGHLIASEFRIGAAFPSTLVKLGVVESKHGEVKLNEKITSLRPSTVRKHINEYVNSHSVVKVKAPKQTIKATSVKTESTFDEIVIALKAKLKQEVMSELLASLK